jgi:hypothetical protein
MKLEGGLSSSFRDTTTISKPWESFSQIKTQARDNKYQTSGRTPEFVTLKTENRKQIT